MSKRIALLIDIVPEDNVIPLESEKELDVFLEQLTEQARVYHKQCPDMRYEDGELYAPVVKLLGCIVWDDIEDKFVYHKG